MNRLRDHLGLARSVRISNVWVVQNHAGERFVIDSGHAVERMALLASLWRAGIRGPGDLTAVILTHRHSDHAGNAAWLRRRFGCPVVCHTADAPYLTGAATAPLLNAPDTAMWAKLLCHIEDRFPAHVQIDEVLEDQDVWWGFRIFHTPGHTGGSMLLHHEPTRTLFSGDAIIGGPPTFRVVERLRLSFDDFSDDGARSRASVREVLERLPPTNTLCSGHGPAVFGDINSKLQGLLQRDVLGMSLTWGGRR